MKHKDPRKRISQKHGLSSDAAIIVALIKEQPLEKNQLIKEASISPSTFSRDEPTLLDENVIKIIDGKYALWNYESKTTLLEKIFKDLKDSRTNAVNLGFLANLAGMPPEEIIVDAYRLAKENNILISE
ncbi:MAG: hypothetical protein ABSA11_01920 [Candidatus Bathyarchaeia archaeon]